MPCARRRRPTVRGDGGHLDIEVVEHLEVVGHETDGADDDGIGLDRRPPAGAPRRGRRGRAKARVFVPRSARPPASRRARPRRPTSAGRLGQLFGVGVAGLPDALGQRVRREDHRSRAASTVPQRLPARGRPAGSTRAGSAYQGCDGARTASSAERGRSPLDVLLRAHGRSVGCEDEADDPFDARRGQLGGGLLNERFGVLGAERHQVAARRAARRARRARRPPGPWCARSAARHRRWRRSALRGRPSCSGVGGRPRRMRV